MESSVAKNQKNWIIRRIPQIEKSVQTALSRIDLDEFNAKEFVEEVCWQVVDDFNDNPYNKLEDIEQLIGFVERNYRSQIRQYYYDNAG